MTDDYDNNHLKNDKIIRFTLQKTLHEVPFLTKIRDDMLSSFFQILENFNHKTQGSLIRIHVIRNHLFNNSSFITFNYDDEKKIKALECKVKTLLFTAKKDMSSSKKLPIFEPSG